MHAQPFINEHKEIQRESDGAFAVLGDEIWTDIGPLPFEDVAFFDRLGDGVQPSLGLLAGSIASFGRPITTTFLSLCGQYAL